MIRILFKDLLKPENSIEKEWYVTNGLGGFISSSVILCNTRRYHGLLNISLEPPYNRYHTLSSFEEDLVIDKKPFKLGVNQYPGVFNPEGYRFLEEFKFDLYPKFTYRLGKVYLEKEIFMVPFKNETIIIYRVENPFESNISFYFHPYFSLRSIHDLNSNEPPAFSDPKIDKKELKLEISKLSHPIRILSTSGIWKKGLDDLKNVIFSTEKHRGLDFSENLYMPGYLHFSSKASKIDFAIRFSAEAVTEFDPYLEKQNFINEKNKFIKESGAVEETDIILVADASNFISLKKDRHGKFSKTIIAGYPWFEDWGRDTMISIPGLLLETNHEDIALEILKNFTKYLKKGLIPNFFNHSSEPVYNTVDASLWFFVAVWEYLHKTGDRKVVRKEFLPTLQEIFKNYWNGTVYGIECDKEDFLIKSGEEGMQLTWMDAKFEDKVFTPRSGKPIEIQGLWYNAVKILSELTEDTKLIERLNEYGKKILNSINDKFWLDDLGYLADVITLDGERDISLRPNSVIASALPFPILDAGKHRRMLEIVTDRLLTPFGLRTLPADHPDYIGYYEGDRYMRDSAYHQGTAWGWLIGPYITAMLRFNEENEFVKEFCRNIINTFSSQIYDGCMGSVSEIFDAEFPNKPKGCFAQAWSTAELIRVRKFFLK